MARLWRLHREPGSHRGHVRLLVGKQWGCSAARAPPARSCRLRNPRAGFSCFLPRCSRPGRHEIWISARVHTGCAVRCVPRATGAVVAESGFGLDASRRVVRCVPAQYFMLGVLHMPTGAAPSMGVASPSPAAHVDLYRDATLDASSEKRDLPTDEIWILPTPCTDTCSSQNITPSKHLPVLPSPRSLPLPVSTSPVCVEKARPLYTP